MSTPPPIKIVILGNAGVGKTSLINRYVYGAYDHGSSGGAEPTVGMQKYAKEVDFQGSKYTVEFWDTAGQEKYMSLGAPYFKGASAVGFVYSLTDPLSFDNGLEMWNFEFISQSGEDPSGGLPYMVMANKSDLETDKNEAKWESEMKEWKEGNINSNSPFYFMKTSAVQGTNVKESMDKMVNMAITLAIERHPQVYKPAAKVEKPSQPPKKKSRCILL